MATCVLPHGFPKCSALAQCRVFDVIKIVLQLHAALSVRDRSKMSRFEGLACCCHGDRPLQPLTLKVSAGLERGLLGLTCE
ncbi:uncharacterized [Tachysurus ichikawai]